MNLEEIKDDVNKLEDTEVLELASYLQDLLAAREADNH